MSGRSMNPSRMPPDEAAMLSFVEGEMSATEEAVFRRGLAHAPQIVARLEAMRRDKASLRASLLREALVPRSLSARVEETLAREAVLGSGGAGTRPRAGLSGPDEALVRSTLETRVVGGGWRKAGLGLAMAAGLALAAGGAFLAMSRGGASGGGAAGAGGQSVAQATPSDEPTGVPGSAEVAPDVIASSGAAEVEPSSSSLSPSEAHPIEVASASLSGDAGADAFQERLASVPFDGALFDLSTDLTGEDPGPELASTRLLPGTVARHDLMALAEQHRLALRVSADEPAAVIEALEAAVAAAEGQEAEAQAGWRVVRESPMTLAGAIGVTLSPGRSPFDDTMSAGPTPGTGGADEDGDGPGRISPEGDGADDPDADADGMNDAWLLRGTEDAMAVYLTEVSITMEALAELDRDLTRRGGSRAGFAALESPIDSVLDRNLLLVPAGDVIWWYHSPRDWSRRTLVPVVVERR